MYVPSETIDFNVKVLNMTTRLKGAKILVNIFYAIVNANSMLQHLSQIKTGIMIRANVSVKSIVRAKRL